jgi:hypothetical protein
MLHEVLGDKVELATFLGTIHTNKPFTSDWVTKSENTAISTALVNNTYNYSLELQTHYMR